MNLQVLLFKLMFGCLEVKERKRNPKPKTQSHRPRNMETTIMVHKGATIGIHALIQLTEGKLKTLNPKP